MSMHDRRSLFLTRSLEIPMRKPSPALLVVGLAILVAAACSSDDGQGHGDREALGSVSQHLTGKCQTQTFQLPCDPDDAGPLTECQGVCSHDPSGKMVCVPIAE